MLYGLDWMDDIALPITLVHIGHDDGEFIHAMSGQNITWESRQALPSLPWDWLPDGVPIYGIADAGSEPAVWFVGEPAGQEERSWHDLVLAIGRQQRILTPMTESVVDGVVDALRIAVLTTPSCPKCAQAVRLLGAMAIRNPKITVYAIDLDKAPELIARWNLQSLPAFVINDIVTVMTANEWILAQAIASAGTAPGKDQAPF